MAKLSFDWRSWRSITAVAATALILAACGGSDDDNTNPPNPGPTPVEVGSTKDITVADAVDTSGTDLDTYEVLSGPSLAAAASASGRKGAAAVPENTLRIHYQRSDNTYTGWTLYAWNNEGGQALVGGWPGLATPTGEDSWGKYWDVPVGAATKINFIIVKDGGGTREPSEWSQANNDQQQYFDIAGGREIWKVSGVTTNFTSVPIPANTLRIHYKRTNADYGDYTSNDFNQFWGVHAFNLATANPGWDTPYKKAGEDDFGVFFDIPLSGPNGTVGYIVHKGNTKDFGDADQTFVYDGSVKEIWRVQGDASTYISNPDTPPVSDLDHVRIHYKRFNADYANWGLHLFGDVDMSRLPTYKNPENAAETAWTTPVPLVNPGDNVVTGTDAFGVFIEIPVKKPTLGGKTLKFIVHGLSEETRNTKDGGDHIVTMALGQEVWMVEGGEPMFTEAEATKVNFSLSQAKAFWVAKDLILWPRVPADGNFKLYTSNRYFDISSADGTASGSVKGALPLTVVDPSTLSDEIKAKYAYLPTPYQVLKINATDDNLKRALRTQLAVVQEAGGKVVNASAVQTAGGLDHIYAEQAKDVALGVAVANGSTSFKLWAPTAAQVAVAVYDNGTTGGASSVTPMTFDDTTGVWSAQVGTDLTGKYYKYIVDVHVRGMGLVRNKVTDPYSISLSTNSKRSYIANLSDAALKPAGWDESTAPNLAAQEDMSIYELHVRDFSVNDPTVPEAHRGKYLAFADTNSNGMKHLKALADAGLTDIHLLPVFDIGTIPEVGCTTPDVSGGPASPDQQATVAATADSDCYNWGYDPQHYTSLEGSYATDPSDGAVRVREFREAVMAMHAAGLRVGMDVVYNHTTAAGQNARSILDRIVPGYYHRYDVNGSLATSTCCANTATENAMMGKLMIDSVVTLATQYKLDSFRFDLMGHQPRSVMEELKVAVNAATGRDIYLVGEGWNFGEVENGARFVQASQLSLNGSGIATFTDRARDASRGGGPFDQGNNLVQNQGFLNGLYYDDNGSGAGRTVTDLMTANDMIKVGLAGSIRSYNLVTRDGSTKTLEQIDYNGQPAGYVVDPQEVVNYVENHDNQTLFDVNVMHLPLATTKEDRARVQMLGAALTAFSQGVGYFHAGIDTMRSKSLDRNSYNAGDWFNRLDWSYSTNYFGIGLPAAGDNQQSWTQMTTRLNMVADIAPTADNIAWTRDMFRELLAVRNSSTLFRMRTAEDIKSRLHFYNTGSGMEPTVIAMHLDGAGYGGANYDDVMVLMNVSTSAKTITVDAEKLKGYAKHPALTVDTRLANATYDNSTGAFVVPARTVVVWVRNAQGMGIARR